MSASDTWIHELAALAASSPQIPELAPLEVGFDIDGKRVGLDLLHGRITDGTTAQCWVSGSERVLSDVASGAMTLQRAHLTGGVHLSGEPEGLLRLAFLLDAARALGGRQQSPSCDVGRE